MRNALIEAMARAMHAAFNAGSYGDYGYPWEHPMASRQMFLDMAESALDAALSILEKPDEDMIIAAINHRDEMDYSGVFVAMLNTLKAPA